MVSIFGRLSDIPTVLKLHIYKADSRWTTVCAECYRLWQSEPDQLDVQIGFSAMDC